MGATLKVRGYSYPMKESREVIQALLDSRANHRVERPIPIGRPRRDAHGFYYIRDARNVPVIHGLRIVDGRS